jgi:hypothetical protein
MSWLKLFVSMKSSSWVRDTSRQGVNAFSIHFGLLIIKVDEFVLSLI